MLQIREMVDADLHDIVAMDKVLYKKPWKESDFLYELHENPYAFYFVMINTENEDIVGYIGFWIKFEFAEVTKVSIAPNYQGHKLSKILMEDMEKRVRLASCVNITLEVRVSNDIAYHLYLKEGYSICATRKKYYENGEDAYLMIKELS